MKNFIIGQHSFFDYKKFRKDFRGGFYGIEACLLDSEEDIENLAAEACRNNLHFQTLTDPSFNTDDILKRFSKYTVLIHLSNTRITDNTVYAHFPALPGLKQEDGWADMNNYLPVIGKINKNIKVLFEHRYDLVTDEELDKCYLWAGQLLYVV